MKPKYWAIIILAVIAISASVIWLYQSQSGYCPAIAGMSHAKGGCVFSLGVNHKNKTQSPATTTLETELKDWKTYTNTGYGFELRYPANMGVEQLDVGDHPFGVFEISTSDKGNTNSYGMGIAAIPETDPQLAEMEESYKKTASEKSITIHGVVGKYFHLVEPGSDGARGSVVLVKNNGRVYILKGVEPLFSQILSTFKFISPQKSDANTGISLKIGGTAEAGEGLMLKLISVADSRCPADVQCVWAGTVTATVELFKNSVSLGEADIEVNKQVKIADYTVALTKVIPEEKKQGAKASDYILNFKIIN